MSNPVLVFDADPAVYMAAFAAQKSLYHVVYETAAGQIKQKVWQDGNQKNRFFKRFPKCTILEEDKIVEVEEVSHARQCAATILRGTIRACAQRFDCSAGEVDVEIYLSGQGNFRSKLATIVPYKSKRLEPPHHYQATRNYFTEQRGAMVVTGWEADDQCSIRCKELAREGKPYILATIDKDLDQVAGPHYNYQKRVTYEVEQEYADRFFWQQCLTGDATDTIQGLVKIGQGRADRLLEIWEGDGHDDEAIWDLIVEQYEMNMGRYPDHYPEGITAEEAALENARLVKMLDYEDQLWNPPGVADGRISKDL